MPSPLAQHALDRGFPSNLIFTPERAGEVIFYHNLVGNDFRTYSFRVINVVTSDVVRRTLNCRNLLYWGGIPDVEMQLLQF